MTVVARQRASSINLRDQIRTAGRVVSSRPALIVDIVDVEPELRAGDRTEGSGEVSPLPGWSSVSFEQAASEVTEWVDATNSAGSIAPWSGNSPEVRAGLDLAVRNLEASRTGCSLAELLGATDTSIAVSELLTGAGSEELGRSAAIAVASGAVSVKVKVGLADDDDRLGAVADALRADMSCRVRLDANGSWDAEEAVAALAKAAALFGGRLEFVEDPVASVDELRILRPRAAVPIAADDLLRTGAPIGSIARLIDVGVVKPTLVGGIGATLTLIEQLVAAGIDPILSSLYDGPVNLRGWCHLAAVVGSERAHGLGTARTLDHPEAVDLLPVGGRIAL